MQQTDRRDAQAEEVDWRIGVDAVGDERRDEGLLDVLRWIEDVLIHAGEKLERVRLGVDIDRLLHHGVETADFIESPGVIDVVVRDEDGIEPVEFRTQGLLTKIRPRVDEDDAVVAVRIGEGDGGAGSEALVARVGAGADFAMTADGGNAGRGSSAKEGESHVKQD